MLLVISQLHIIIREQRLAIEAYLSDKMTDQGRKALYRGASSDDDESHNLEPDDITFRYKTNEQDTLELKYLKEKLNLLRDLEEALGALKVPMDLAQSSWWEVLYNGLSYLPYLPTFFKIFQIWPEVAGFLAQCTPYDINKTVYNNIKNLFMAVYGYLPETVKALNWASTIHAQHPDVTLKADTATDLLFSAIKIAQFPEAKEGDDFTITCNKLDALAQNIHELAVSGSYLQNGGRIASSTFSLGFKNLTDLINNANQQLETQVQGGPAHELLAGKIRQALIAYKSLINKLESYEKQLGLQENTLVGDDDKYRVFLLDKLYVLPAESKMDSIPKSDAYYSLADMIKWLARNMRELVSDLTVFIFKNGDNLSDDNKEKLSKTLPKIDDLAARLENVSEKGLFYSIFSTQYFYVVYDMYQIITTWTSISDLWSQIKSVDFSYLGARITSTIAKINALFSTLSATFSFNKSSEVSDAAEVVSPLLSPRVSSNRNSFSLPVQSEALLDLSSVPTAVSSILVALNIVNESTFSNFLKQSASLHNVMKQASKIMQGQEGVLGSINFLIENIGVLGLSNLLIMQKNAHENIALTAEQKQFLTSLLTDINELYCSVLCELDRYEKEFGFRPGALTEKLAGITNAVAQLYSVAGQFKVITGGNIKHYPYYDQRPIMVNNMLKVYQAKYQEILDRRDNHSYASFINKDDSMQLQLSYLIGGAQRLIENSQYTPLQKLEIYRQMLSAVESEMKDNDPLKAVIAQQKAELPETKAQVRMLNDAPVNQSYTHKGMTP